MVSIWVSWSANLQGGEILITKKYIFGNTQMSRVLFYTNPIRFFMVSESGYHY